jgi:hypothetical protein
MKNHSLLAATILFLALPGIQPLQAQKGTADLQLSGTETMISIASENESFEGTALATDMVPTKVLSSFNKQFKSPTNLEWSSLGNFYLANFLQGNLKSRAFFLKNGNMPYLINRGEEGSLPNDYRQMVRSNFVDYKIGTVNEVRVGFQKAWLVNLENDKEIVIARVLDDELDILKQYKTQPKLRRKGRIIVPHN